MNRDELFTIREGVEDDNSFIYATFLRGLYYGDSWFSEIPKAVFMQEYHKVIEGILNHPDTKVSVACLKDDPEVILGYALLDHNSPSILHFVFVKKAFRGIGIAKSLVPTTVTSVTHSTKSGLSIIKKRGISFNPFFKPRS